jgi:hypothetical protein
LDRVSGAALGDKAYFAGRSNDQFLYNLAFAFNVSTGDWDTLTLSSLRHEPTVAAVGNKILFAGGEVDNPPLVLFFQPKTRHPQISDLSYPFQFRSPKYLHCPKA